MGKKLKLAMAAACVLAVAGCSSTETDARTATAVVARQDFTVGQDLRPHQIMGRDFWHVLGVSQDTQPAKGNWANTYMRELVDKPLFKESALNYLCVKNITVPDSNKVSIAAMDAHAYLELIDSKPETPFFIMPGGVRPVYRLMKPFDCDMANYDVWKKAHPNFMGCVNGETDNDFLSSAPWRDYWWRGFKKTCADKGMVAAIERDFPQPRNRAELTAQYLKGCEAFRKFFFDDADKVNFMRAAHCHDHYYYESGASVGWLETTNTGAPDGMANYRHQVSLFFARGASRQYHKDWAWYIAVFYNGYDDKGRFSGDNVPNCREEKVKTTDAAGGVTGPEAGMSPSLCARDMFLAYLGGASFVEHEGWWGFLRETMKDGKRTWDLSSPFGKAWEDWFEFTRKNPDRGTSYAPVALLVPFEQGYPNYGGKSWQTFDYERPDWMVDAFMFTIMPHSPVTRRGDEGALANSPYGDIYDVIVPNTPGKPVALKVLDNYKAAVMLGGYPKSAALAQRLMEYVGNGGTLLINVKQLDETFPKAFLGLERTGVSRPVGKEIVSLVGGGTFPLTDKYECEGIKLAGAKPILVDADKQVLACANAYGKGRVVVTTVDNLLPKNDMGDQAGNVLAKMVYGKEFPFVQCLLGQLVKEVLPLEVKGDVEYGLNKLDDGWLLYLINNKGVTKLANKAQVLDPSKAAKVVVSLKDIKASQITELRTGKAIPLAGGSFAVEVPPGDLRVIKLRD